MAHPPIDSAEVVVPCPDLDDALAFFTETLGFRLESIFPADAPREATLCGHGLHLRLRRGPGTPPTLRLVCTDPAALAAAQLVAPGGARIELAAAATGTAVAALRPSFVHNPLDDASFAAGRAGMLYRDLVPDRQGGRVIASHIRIPRGGPVPDYVHYHEVRAQMIYCYRGRVEVVYQDQGEPFELGPGDCVLQPSTIRHRVLSCSDGLEVIEVTSPAEHVTRVDHHLDLPNGTAGGRRYGGQPFVLHRAAAAARDRPWYLPGFTARDLGLASATDGCLAARVVRRDADASPTSGRPAPARLWFVLQGTAVLARRGRRHPLAPGTALALPDDQHELAATSSDLELLEVDLT